jgi:hypothetical protein
MAGHRMVRGYSLNPPTATVASASPLSAATVRGPPAWHSRLGSARATKRTSSQTRLPGGCVRTAGAGRTSRPVTADRPDVRTTRHAAFERVPVSSSSPRLGRPRGRGGDHLG